MPWLDVIEKLWPIALFGAQLATAVVVLWLKSQFAPRKALDEVRATVTVAGARLDAALAALPPAGAWSEHRDRVTDAHHKIDLLTQKVGTLPDADQVRQIRDAIADMRAAQTGMRVEVDSLKFSIDRTAVGVQRIESYLLERKA